MKTKKCILSVLTLVFTVTVHAQNWTSGLNSGGSNNQISTDVAESPGGGKIVVGTYIGATTFGSNTLAHYFSFPTAIPDGFIVSYSATNAVLWATRIVSAAGVFISSVTTTSDGQIYVCGSFANPCEFYNADNPMPLYLIQRYHRIQHHLQAQLNDGDLLPNMLLTEP